MMYGATNAWHGIWMGVNANGVFYVKGSGYQQNGNSIEYTCAPSTLNLATFADQKLKLRVEMREVSEDGTSANISVWINDTLVCQDVAVQRFSEVYATLGNKVYFCAVGTTNAITIPE